jgi:hypothetical protein
MGGMPGGGMPGGMGDGGGMGGGMARAMMPMAMPPAHGGDDGRVREMVKLLREERDLLKSDLEQTKRNLAALATQAKGACPPRSLRTESCETQSANSTTALSHPIQ